MSRRRVDRGKVTERHVGGDPGRQAGEVAQELGNLAREFAIRHIGPLLTPDRRAAILQVAATAHPVMVEIRLNMPRSVSLTAAGIELARVEFDTLQ